jgi:hypothetical protein
VVNVFVKPDLTKKIQRRWNVLFASKENTKAFLEISYAQTALAIQYRHKEVQTSLRASATPDFPVFLLMEAV